MSKIWYRDRGNKICMTVKYSFSCVDDATVSERKKVDKEKHIRQLESRDRTRIEEIVVSSGNFNDVEIETALELVDEAIEKGDESGYIFAIQAGEVKSNAPVLTLPVGK